MKIISTIKSSSSVFSTIGRPAQGDLGCTSGILKWHNLVIYHHVRGLTGHHKNWLSVAIADLVTRINDSLSS
jgi:hypothetical protein